MGCGADTEANELITSLTVGKDFEIPEIDLDGPEFQIPPDSDEGIFAPITRLTNDDLTTGSIDGVGTFDALMRGFKAHLREEYDKGRITGADYTKAYIELTQAAMGNATQYLLGRDQAYWAAITAQYAAKLARVQEITARIQLVSAKVQAVSLQFDAANQEASYALTKLKLSSESITYCIGKYNLDNILPAQLKLNNEQMEAARAQTLNTRTDGTTVVGSMGKQKDLYTQQITSYQRDAEVKAAKLFTDAWITMKTIDEGLLPPENFENDSLNDVLADIKTNNNIG